MFKIGDKVSAYTYTNTDRIKITGTVISRTDDPEEYYQAYYIQCDDGEVYCCDEQETYG